MHSSVSCNGVVQEKTWGLVLGPEPPINKIVWEIKPGSILDYDQDDRVVGIEFLGVSIRASQVYQGKWRDDIFAVTALYFIHVREEVCEKTPSEIRLHHAETRQDHPGNCSADAFLTALRV